MTAEAERLLTALCAPTVTTGEALGFLGTDAIAIAVAKPSRIEQPTTFICLHRPTRRHPWREMGRGATQRAAMEQAERAGCRNGEWRFEAEASDNRLSLPAASLQPDGHGADAG